MNEEKKLHVKEYAEAAVQILLNAKSGDVRVTANKLVDALLCKGQANLRLNGWKPPPFPKEYLIGCGIRFVIETTIAFMLLGGHLKEDFHFTPYSTIR